MPSLAEPLDEDSPDEYSMLYDAYNDMQNTTQITMSCIPQLQSVYTKAKARLAQLAAGQDIFGHSPNWAPRLSYNYYDTHVTALLESLEKLEAGNLNYLNALKAQTDASESIQEGIDQLQDSIDKANDRITLLTDSNGILEMSAIQIATYTPQLKDYRTQISGEVMKVKNDIQNNINM